jgi:hypothetical protein
MSKYRTLRYVNYERIEDHLLLGWLVVWPMYPVRYHDSFGVTMEWLCDCKTVEPAGKTA